MSWKFSWLRRSVEMAHSADFESEPEASRVFPGYSQAVDDLRKKDPGNSFLAVVCRMDAGSL